MKRRIREIIAFLMDPDSSELRDPAFLQDELEDMGYSGEEIRQALSMLDFEFVIDDRGDPEGMQSRNRILGESEKLVLSTAAQGYLLHLYRLGWISEAQLNLIIENAAIEFNPPVSLDEVREITVRYVSDLPEGVPPDSARRNGFIN